MNQMLYISDYMAQDIMNIHNVTNGEPKEIVKSINRTMETPKYLSQIYGVGASQILLNVEIRKQVTHVNRIRTYCNCSEDLTSKGVRKLKTIYYIRTNNTNFNFKRVYNLILLEDLFIIAYKNLKFKKKIITLDAHKLNQDELKIKFIQNIIENLQKETFEFSPIRRIYTPKCNNNSQLLPIPSFKDKLVQEVIRIILESIYSPRFLSCSHGFQKNKRCHTALKDVRTIFTGVKWLIKRDIEKCFNSFNHHKLINILKKRISDQRFINLIWKLFQAGYLEDFKLLSTSLTEIPQGEVIRPILSNIYLHEFDLFIIDLIKKFNKYIYHANNQKYSNFQPYHRLQYVRYADDFIIGVIGNVNDAKLIKKKINLFLSKKLLFSVSSKKNKLVNASQDKIKFLGINVRVLTHKKTYFPSFKHIHYKKIQLTKSSQILIKLKVDIKSLIFKLHSAGFCTKLGVPTPHFQLYAIRQNNIILIYNKIFQDLKNYFRFVDNYNALALTLQYILINSCAKLLAAKLKLKTVKSVYKKFGKYLNHNETIFYWSKSYTKNRIRFIINKSSSNWIFSLYIKKYINTDLITLCIICKFLNKIKIQHIKHIKKIKLRLLIKNYTITNHKQIPLCASCHYKIHKILH